MLLKIWPSLRRRLGGRFRFLNGKARTKGGLRSRFLFAVFCVMGLALCARPGCRKCSMLFRFGGPPIRNEGQKTGRPPPVWLRAPFFSGRRGGVLPVRRGGRPGRCDGVDGQGKGDFMADCPLFETPRPQRKWPCRRHLDGKRAAGCLEAQSQAIPAACGRARYPARCLR